MSSAKYLTDLSGSVYVNNNSGIISPATVRSFNSRLIENTFPATYVITNQTEFEQWVNNNTYNDYTYVFIKKGTYNTTEYINLSTAKTIGIYCEPGTIINATITTASPAAAMGYDSLSDYSTERFCNNLTLNCTLAAESSLTLLAGMRYMYNLTNCSVNVTILRTGGSAVGIGFRACYNVNGCRASGTNDIAVTGASVRGYDACTMVVNSEAKNISSAYNAIGFYNCNRIFGCFSWYISSPSSPSAFTSCNYIHGCWGTLSTSQGSVYNSCKSLYGCYGNQSASTSGAVYNSCRRLYGCTSYRSSSGNHFSSCRVMFGCGPASSAVYGTVYSSCYMTASGTTYPVGDTAAGGYNQTSYV